MIRFPGYVTEYQYVKDIQKTKLLVRE